MAEDASGKQIVAAYVADNGARMNIHAADCVMVAKAQIPEQKQSTDDLTDDLSVGAKRKTKGPKERNPEHIKKGSSDESDEESWAQSMTRDHDRILHYKLKMIVQNYYAADGANMNIQASDNAMIANASIPGLEGAEFSSGGFGKHRAKKKQKRIKGSFKISDTITMLYKKHLPPGDTRSMVCEGIMSSSSADNQPIAIKSIPHDHESLREAEILKKLAFHPHVVSTIHADVYYMGVEKRIYIAMELCSSKSLNDFVMENKLNGIPFDPKQSTELAKQLVEGMKHIHEYNIIHRDMKPHNVLFSVDLKTVKIADFGLSKEITSGYTETVQTSPGIGTTGYRSPETYNGYVISQKSDIFSLGLTIFFIWSNGLHPFGVDPQEWDYNIKNYLKRLIRAQLLIPEPLAFDLLAWMMRFEPEDRPTAEQILTHKMFGGMETAVGEDDYSTERCVEILNKEAERYRDRRIIVISARR